MHCLSNIPASFSLPSAAKSLVAAALCITVAACSSNGPARTAGTVATPAASSEMKATIKQALCEGRADDAVKQLTAEPLASPTDRFFLALSLEQSGHPTRAQMFYAQLMQTGYNGYVRVHCGRNVLVDGSVSEEAARRLAVIARNLAIMDVNLRPTPRLHKGIPPAEPASKKSGSTYSGPALDVGKPGSQSPFGQWFAHLASYRSIDNAMKNKGTLEGKFPALAGVIDQWEVITNGRQTIRLGIRVQEKADAQNLCQAVKSHGEYCAVIDTSS